MLLLIVTELRPLSEVGRSEVLLQETIARIWPKPVSFALDKGPVGRRLAYPREMHAINFAQQLFLYSVDSLVVDRVMVFTGLTRGLISLIDLGWKTAISLSADA